LYKWSSIEELSPDQQLTDIFLCKWVHQNPHLRKGEKTEPSKKPIEIIEINSPCHESNLTFKRLRTKLKDIRDENEKLKEENLEVKIKVKTL